MKNLIGISLIAFLLPVISHANDRYQQMQKWLDAHEAEQRQAEQDAAKAEKERKKRIQNCAKAKDHSQRYQRAGRLYSFDEKGERRYLSDDERVQAQQRMAGAVDKWCN